MKLVPITSITIGENRQRKFFDPDALADLVESIARRGLLHPIVVREDGAGFVLVAGERRLTAIRDLNEFEIPFRHGGAKVPWGLVPITPIGELPDLAAREAELEENIIRLDLTLQERAIAVRNLHEMRDAQRAIRGEPPQTKEDTQRELGMRPETFTNMLRIAEHIELPEVAKAKTITEARRAVDRHILQNQFRAAAEGGAKPASIHTCILSESIDYLDRAEPGEFDCIVTDPPYGVDANRMNTFGTTNHTYADGEDYWRTLMEEFSVLAHRACAEEAHCYVFCSILRFFELADIFRTAGWKVWKYPFIWDRGSGLIPDPDHGPQRSYDAILFANKGLKKVLFSGSDVLRHSIIKATAFAAEKPIDLYLDLLRRSVGPGARVLDPFCGSGTIFPAASRLGLIATGIERDSETFKIALGRANLCSDRAPPRRDLIEEQPECEAEGAYSI